MTRTNRIIRNNLNYEKSNTATELRRNKQDAKGGGRYNKKTKQNESKTDNDLKKEKKEIKIIKSTLWFSIIKLVTHTIKMIVKMILTEYLVHMASCQTKISLVNKYL